MSSSAVYSEDKEYIRELLTRRLPLQDPAASTSVAVPNSKKPGYTAVYRNGATPDKLYDCIHPALNTYYALYRNAVDLFPNNRFMGTRKYDAKTKKFEDKYTWETYSQISVRITNVGSGILAAISNNPFKTDGLNEEDFIVSIFAGNREEWLMTDLACSAYSLTDTALYDTLGPDASKYILTVTGSPIVICSKEKIAGLLDLKIRNPEDLKNVIVVVSMDLLDPSDELYQMARDVGIILYDFAQLQQLGAVHPRPERPPTPDTVFTISFTSGTTGANPKGVVLTQRMATSGITCCLVRMMQPRNATSYVLLPLAHIYERMNAGFGVCTGAALGFPQVGGTPLTMFEDLRILKPTSLTSVPRIYTKMESAIKAATIDSHSPLTKKLSNHIIEARIKAQSADDTSNADNFFHDLLLTKKLRAQFGLDNLKVCYTGSAPIAHDSLVFLRAALGVGMAQGYGMTESYAAVAFSNPFESDPGSCGSISCCAEMRLMDLPEMGYTANDSDGSRGELCMRGPQIFQYYYKNDEETTKAFDEEGWFHTGDIGKIDSQGRLSIIDRVKNFFKLAQGEYVTPEKVENKYLSCCSLINQLYVHGDSLRTHLVAIVGVDPAIITQHLIKNLDYTPDQLDSNIKIVEALSQPNIKKDLLLRMNESIKDMGLQGFEKIHNIHVEIEPLTVARNVVTPTLKLKRPVASKFFRVVFDDLYNQGSIIRDAKM